MNDELNENETKISTTKLSAEKSQELINEINLLQTSISMHNKRILTEKEAKILFRFYEKVLSDNAMENTKYYNFIFKATDEEVKDIIGEELFNNDEKMTNFLLDFDDLGYRLMDTYKRMVKNYTDNNIQPLTNEEVEAINQWLIKNHSLKK